MFNKKDIFENKKEIIRKDLKSYNQGKKYGFEFFRNLVIAFCLISLPEMFNLMNGQSPLLELDENSMLYALMRLLYLSVFGLSLVGWGILASLLFEFNKKSQNKNKIEKFCLNKNHLPYYISLYKEFKYSVKFRNFVKVELLKLSNKQKEALKMCEDTDLIENLKFLEIEYEKEARKKLEDLEEKRKQLDKDIKRQKENIGIEEVEYKISND